MNDSDRCGLGEIGPRRRLRLGPTPHASNHQPFPGDYAIMFDDRKQAIVAARSAVRAYAKDPSERNAAEVDAAWTAFMHVQAQQQREMRVRAHFGMYED